MKLLPLRRMRWAITGCASVFCLVWLSATNSDPQNTETLTVYDSALLTLRDFVAAGDNKLGFSNAREVDSAHIALDQGVRVYFLRNDTARSGFNAYDTLLMDLGRVVYPVYTNSNGVSQLRSCITFDSLGGVHPVMFDDSTLILAAVRYQRLSASANTKCGMIMVPTLGINAMVAHTATGDSVLDTDELRHALGRHGHPQMSTQDLVHAVRARLQSR